MHCSSSSWLYITFHQVAGHTSLFIQQLVIHHCSSSSLSYITFHQVAGHTSLFIKYLAIHHFLSSSWPCIHHFSSRQLQFYPPCGPSVAGRPVWTTWLWHTSPFIKQLVIHHFSSSSRSYITFHQDHHTFKHPPYGPSVAGRQVWTTWPCHTSLGRSLGIRSCLATTRRSPWGCPLQMQQKQWHVRKREQTTGDVSPILWTPGGGASVRREPWVWPEVGMPGQAARAGAVPLRSAQRMEQQRQQRPTTGKQNRSREMYSRIQ